MKEVDVCRGLLRWGTRLCGGAAALLLGLLLGLLPALGGAAWAATAPAVGEFTPPWWTAVPFAGILLSIALLPLLAHTLWEKHYDKVSVCWLLLALVIMYLSVPAGQGFKAVYGGQLFFVYEEFISFIILLGSLFIISGGVHIYREAPATPFYNTLLLLIGSLLASVIGTTGAAMLAIRPLLHANEKRRHKTHVVMFFIFTVCNIGGALTPIGDPPLFLGFLQGVPFFWTLRLLPAWALTLGVLLPLFFLLDTLLSRREPRAALYAHTERSAHHHRGVTILRIRGQAEVTIAGLPNLLLLAGVVGAVILSGVWHPPLSFSVFGLGEIHGNTLFRDGTQILLAAISLLITPQAVRRSNRFSFAPIREVAVVFFGIFTAMAPVLMLLAIRGTQVTIDSPAAFMWSTGILSAFLDNAPTYVAFLTTGISRVGVADAAAFAQHPVGAQLLLGISIGAVFFGALTYIGNGPNFMVKSIAQAERVRMPSFFGYMFYACLVLLPVYALVTWLFL